jgi:hypothetical protein
MEEHSSLLLVDDAVYARTLDLDLAAYDLADVSSPLWTFDPGGSVLWVVDHGIVTAVDISVDNPDDRTTSTVTLYE